MTGTWIEVFKAGRQTDSSGNTREWTEQDLDDIVARYNGQTDHEAPIVVGHPEHNSPAFGWVEALKRDGKLLFGKFRDVMPEFADLVKAGTYKKRSISLYPDLTLRHIGFLGGMPPAVKGLADIAFRSGEEAVTYEFGESRLESMKQKFIQFLDGMFGETSMPEDQVNHNVNKETSMKPEEVQALVAKTIEETTRQFSEQLQPLGETIKSLTTQIAELKSVREMDREDGLRREFAEFLMKPDMQARIPEGSRAATINQMLTLVSAEPVDFGEGDTRVKLPALEAYKRQLAALPCVVTFGEHATRDKVGDTRVNGMSAELLSQKAVEFQDAEARAGRTISMTQAVNHIKAGGTA